MSRIIGIDADELEQLLERASQRGAALAIAGVTASEWLDAKGVAKLLGVHPKSVQAMVRRQALPAHRIGTRSYRYHRAEVETWMRERSTRKAG